MLDTGALTKRFAYDKDDRLTTATDGENHATTYGYNAAYQITSITDANSAAEAFSYDTDGRGTRCISAEGITKSYVLDLGDRIRTRTISQTSLPTAPR